MKTIDTEKFKEDILQSDLYKNPQVDVCDKVEQYNLVLGNLLDTHAPEKTKMIANKDKRPWMNKKIADAKKKEKEIRKKMEKNKVNCT